MASLVTTKCKICLKEFLGEKYYVNSGRKKYCSKKCLGKANSIRMAGKINENLATPEVIEKMARSKMGKPSTKKGRRYPDLQGENSSNWKGGKTSQDRLERVRFRRLMHKVILKRDDYACATCNIRGVNMHVDHIKSWAEYPDLRFVESNCQTLCMKCHYKKTFGKDIPKGVSWGNNLCRVIESVGN